MTSLGHKELRQQGQNKHDHSKQNFSKHFLDRKYWIWLQFHVSLFLGMQEIITLHLYRKWFLNKASKKVLTHWGWDKMADTSQTLFSNAFLWEKKLHYDLNFIDFYCRTSWIWHLDTIGSDKGLAPNRWQVIIVKNDDFVYWLKYASSDPNELTKSMMTNIYWCIVATPCKIMKTELHEKTFPHYWPSVQRIKWLCQISKAIF